MWIKFLRWYGEFVPGDVARFEAGAAESLCRKGFAMPAPADLFPRLRQPQIETAMVEPDAELLVERRTR